MLREALRFVFGSFEAVRIGREMAAVTRLLGLGRPAGYLCPDNALTPSVSFPRPSLVGSVSVLPRQASSPRLRGGAPAPRQGRREAHEHRPRSGSDFLPSNRQFSKPPDS